jgi:hypothetical protein
MPVFAKRKEASSQYLSTLGIAIACGFVQSFALGFSTICGFLGSLFGSFRKGWVAMISSSASGPKACAALQVCPFPRLRYRWQNSNSQVTTNCYYCQ